MNFLKDKRKPRSSKDCGLVYLTSVIVSDSLYNMTGADAAGAYLYASDSALTNSLNLLQVRVPCTTCLVVRVADIISEAGTFSTDFTYSGH